MTTRRHRLPALALAAWMGGAGAAPVAPAPQEAARYQHKQWTAADGAPLQITSMAQTSDGWLWLGTFDGLYRFDGLRFMRYPLPRRTAANSSRIIALHAGPRDDLYIAYAGEGLSRLAPDGTLEALPPGPAPAPAQQVNAMVVDTDGSLWTMHAGIEHLQGGRWVTVAPAADWAGTEQRSFAIDAQGRLWAVSDRATWRLDRARMRFERVLDVGGEPVLAPDGRLWLLEPDGGARVIAAAGNGAPVGRAAGHYAGQFGPDGALWLLAGCPQRVCVVPDAAGRPGARYAAARAATLHFPGAATLSGMVPHGALADREGNVWIATENGLDRYRRKAFEHAGLPGIGTQYSLATDADGRMWAASAVAATLWRLPVDGPPRRQPGPATVIARDAHGALLVGTPRAIERRSDDAAERIALPPGPDGKPVDRDLFGILDDGQVLWTSSRSTGLIGWRDGRWLARDAFRLPPKIFQSAAGGPGRLWLATGDGKLFHYDGASDTSSATDIAALGTVSAIFPDGDLTVSGDGGMGVVRGGALHLLRAADPDVLRNVSGRVITPDGNRWFNGAAGLVRVRADDWRRSVDDPAVPLRYRLFDALDGYPGHAVIENRWPSAWSPDGRHLWLATTGSVVRFDTGARLPAIPAPTASILRVATDGESYAPRGPLALPAGTGSLRIEYTAPVLHAPERVRFEYRLDGIDRGWQDAGNRRAISYTNIGPGDYVFRVRALDEDGLTGPEDATLALSVAPTLTQSGWFRLLCLASVAMLGVALYRYRVRRLTARLAERMRVKTAERERIARTLHDTFLQTVQGLVLRVDAVAAALPPGDGARRQLEALLADAGRAIGEGREQLQELRAGDALVLDDVLHDAVARLRAAHGIDVALRVEGERRALDPLVADEVADVAREALRNACRHAGAAHVRATLSYGRQALALLVADDGRGFPDEVLRAGARAGHWGLVGLRERATRIGARLAVGNGPRGGAQVTLEVPAARAYAAAPPSR
ncbi:two-component regulator propeller domain-containing protein [uncultured Massilia sp.]|uniref:sensor histidine kinase n=1 Tax=uncultured Massilia sp. TaxID=169973 RepID=UPI0025E335D9|nr:two-component regulator propeller domain-containing protein [uncultured Massilia sp.]